MEHALAGGDVPGAIEAYFRLRAGQPTHEPALLRALALGYLSSAVERGQMWDPAERQAALHALGRSGQDAAVPLLASLRKDTSWRVRWTAVEALDSIKTPAATEALQAALGDTDRRVRCAAGTLLLTRGKPTGAQAALECGAPAPLQYRGLRTVLRHAEEIPAEALAAVAQHPTQHPRVALAAVIARRGRAGERAALARLEMDTKPMVKRAARGARAVHEHRADAKRALAPFRALLGGNPEQQLTAVFLLGLMGRPVGGPAVDLLAEVIRTRGPGLRGQACTALGHLQLEQALPVLAGVLEGAQDVRVKRKAVVALSRLGSPEAGPLLRRLLAPSTPPPLQAVAAAGLAELEGPEAHAALAELLGLSTSRSPAVAMAAANAVASLVTPADSPQRPTLRRLLASPFPAVRSQGAYALARLGQPDVASDLAPLLRDTNRAVHYAACAALLQVLPGRARTDAP